MAQDMTNKLSQMLGLPNSPLAAEAERQRREEEARYIRQMQQVAMSQLAQMNMLPMQYLSSSYGYEVDPKVAQKKLSAGIAALRDIPAVRLSKPMPDHVATLTGWRGWKVNKHGLMALGQSSAWEPKKAPAAICTKSADAHASPVRDCTCGFWSFRSMEVLEQALERYADSVVVVGSVEIWGKVIECENGFRSEFAYPKELWLLRPGLEYLSWMYGVPVRQVTNG